jgi:hypothetical protein
MVMGKGMLGGCAGGGAQLVTVWTHEKTTPSGRGATVQEARPSGVVGTGYEGDDECGDGAVCDGVRFLDVRVLSRRWGERARRKKQIARAIAN